MLKIVSTDSIYQYQLDENNYVEVVNKQGKVICKITNYNLDEQFNWCLNYFSGYFTVQKEEELVDCWKLTGATGGLVGYYKSINFTDNPSDYSKLQVTVSKVKMPEKRIRKYRINI